MLGFAAGDSRLTGCPLTGSLGLHLMPVAGRAMMHKLREVEGYTSDGRQSTSWTALHYLICWQRVGVATLHLLQSLTVGIQQLQGSFTVLAWLSKCIEHRLCAVHSTWTSCLLRGAGFRLNVSVGGQVKAFLRHCRPATQPFQDANNPSGDQRSAVKAAVRQARSGTECLVQCEVSDAALHLVTGPCNAMWVAACSAQHHDHVSQCSFTRCFCSSKLFWTEHLWLHIGIDRVQASSLCTEGVPAWTSLTLTCQAVMVLLYLEPVTHMAQAVLVTIAGATVSTMLCNNFHVSYSLLFCRQPDAGAQIAGRPLWCLQTLLGSEAPS